MIRTQYGQVDIDVYNQKFSDAMIVDLIKFIKGLSSTTSVKALIDKGYNVRCILEDEDSHGKNIPELLGACVEIDNVEIANFIYHKLVYNDQYSNLMWVDPWKIKSQKMKDLLILYHGQFGKDYEHERNPHLEKIRSLSLSSKSSKAESRSKKLKARQYLFAKKIFRKILFWTLFESHYTSGEGNDSCKHNYKSVSDFSIRGSTRLLEFMLKNKEDFEIATGFIEADEDERTDTDFECFEIIVELFPVISGFHADDTDAVKELFLNEYKIFRDLK